MGVLLATGIAILNRHRHQAVSASPSQSAPRITACHGSSRTTPSPPSILLPLFAAASIISHATNSSAYTVHITASHRTRWLRHRYHRGYESRYQQLNPAPVVHRHTFSRGRSPTRYAIQSLRAIIALKMTRPSGSQAYCYVASKPAFAQWHLLLRAGVVSSSARRLCMATWFTRLQQSCIHLHLGCVCGQFPQVTLRKAQ
jgi:hypothetical protein